ncbi:hypothetical protein ABK040_002676 [Willaertia magna]
MHAVNRCKELLERVYGTLEKNNVTNKFNFRPINPEIKAASRYLWTDAFGVCNFLSLYVQTKENQYLELAKGLIEEVHNILGFNRSLTKRLGNANEEHPLLGGLRIGKDDEEGLPDGDGQYFHYLTKWMFVLNRLSIILNDVKYNNWAIELAESIHDRFVSTRIGHRPRMFWKISIDMSHPVVPSEGNLDPFDGFITYRLLKETAMAFDTNRTNVLNEQIEDFRTMVNLKYSYYHSSDPLDLGESLWIAHWYMDEDWAQHISRVALHNLDELWKKGKFKQSYYRLAFREFGTTLGLQMYMKQDRELEEKWRDRIENVHSYWDKKVYDRDEDITPVMYCTSLFTGVMDRTFLSSFKIGNAQ